MTCAKAGNGACQEPQAALAQKGARHKPPFSHTPAADRKADDTKAPAGPASDECRTVRDDMGWRRQWGMAEKGVAAHPNAKTPTLLPCPAATQQAQSTHTALYTCMMPLMTRSTSTVT
mmetsp:Transcript_65787/g.203770  ORF Transcript_65787/g.203770 Transcript_65787/m.203770 type:complete len:118 (+) Transcript_65787:1-354(+)